MKITPVILAGGSGTRLWPLSRKSYPKQFAKIFSDNSLFQQVAKRSMDIGLVRFSPPLILTNSDFRFVVAEQLRDIGVNSGEILIEPQAKNTAPSVLAASIFCFHNDPDALVLVSPSDHLISDNQCFHQSVMIAIDHAVNGNIVTFGVKPSRPETGYGYLETSKVIENNVLELKRFIEKPASKDAIKMIKSESYLWNSGIFLFRAIDMIKAFKKYNPDMVKFVSVSIDEGKRDLDFFRLAYESWQKCENISLDYAIMEKINNIVVVPFNSKWNDLGDWEAVWEEFKPNSHGVVRSRNAHSIDCKNTLLRSENPDQELVGLGLDGVIAVAMPDAVLVAKKTDAQKVRKVVEHLKNKKVSQAEFFPMEHRPWGWFERLTVGEKFQVKRIFVYPGASLSLQSHNYRSEHWILVEGKAKITINKKSKLIKEGQSVHIPVGSVHRLENPGKTPMLLIEVQTGTYFGEDDIIRYDDVYARDRGE